MIHTIKRWPLRKLLLVFFACTAQIICAETLFYKGNGAPITEQEHQVIYTIMLEYQFPMNSMYGSYVPNEIQAINDKIKQKLPQAGIIGTFIPTTLYELFVLNFIRENVDSIKQKSYGIIEKSRDKLISYIAYEIEPKHFKDINLDSDLIKFHLAINNYILEILQKHNFKILIVLNDFLKIVDAIDFWQYLQVSSGGFYYGKGGKNYLDPKDMKRAIEIEYQAQNNDNFVIYRGANVTDDEQDPSTSKNDPINKRLNRSISFGSTLLGGIFLDKGACAYCYMSDFEERPVGYALLIKKKEYAQGQLSNMFYIPPLITLLDLLGKGEFFHTRTKVPDLKNVTPLSFQKAYEFLVPYIKYYQIDAPNLEEAQKIYNNALSYIRDNHIILKKRELPRP